MNDLEKAKNLHWTWMNKPIQLRKMNFIQLKKALIDVSKPGSTLGFDNNRWNYCIKLVLKHRDPGYYRQILITNKYGLVKRILNETKQ